ncbi:uncharacterized protein LOC119097025 [Pollicipes pollicipes]|uniref:uncharacterized protein LOC119097025 n=1 Tax=Pollicipes pollicipes TaxID=41117 RepID=UPI0018851ED1|nr:uncharacterized protein LOC119097025 [Pollicipes pollicipes]
MENAGNGKKQASGAHLVKKVMKPLLRLLHRRRCQQKLKALEEGYVPVGQVTVWQADVSAEIDDNSVNEALEARLKELIAASPHAEVSRGQLQVKVTGTLTLQPVRRVRFEDELCHPSAAGVTRRQQAQAQRPTVYRKAQLL